MKIAVSLLVALVAVLSAAPAVACMAASRSMTLEFAPGSAEIDETDRKEMELFAQGFPPFGWDVSVRAFADTTGPFTPESWTKADVALAEARASAAREALFSFGRPPMGEQHIFGVAPNGDIPTRPDAAGGTRFGRVVVVAKEPSGPAAPAVPGAPVPVC